MAHILDGKKARDFYKTQLIERVKALPFQPKLVIIQIGNKRESTIYIEQKKKFGAALGVLVDHVQFPESVSREDVQNKIHELNTDSSVHGIIIQLPIPVRLDVSALLNLISLEKDVDGLATGAIYTPATAKGVGLLLDFYHIAVAGKKVAVFGRSRLVGGPIATLMCARGADVSTIHSKTEHPEDISSKADIVIVAIGNAKHIGMSYIRDGAVVIDVGINSAGGAKLVGDVDFDEVASKVSAISPVPGGVGPMTVLSLFDNLVSSAYRLLVIN